MRTLLAPIMVTPTKALTPSHVKGLLWADALYKANARLSEVQYTLNRRVYDLTLQSLEFWAYLDREYPAEPIDQRSEVWIAQRYVDFRRQQPRLDPERIARYRQAVEQEGWIHPAGARIVEIWRQYFELMGVYDPGIGVSRPLAWSLPETLECLSRLDCLLDARGMGGGVLIDFTAEGAPLRLLVDEHGTENYLACVLRDLLPTARAYDRVLLLSDEQLSADYLLIERILSRLGVAVVRMALGRVPLDGRVQSARAGGWEQYTFDRLFERYAGATELDVFKLGMRLYFIAMLGRSAAQSFSFVDLDRAMLKAHKVITAMRSAAPDEEFDRFLRELSVPAGYVSPYRLVSKILARRLPDNAAAIVASLL